MQYAFIFKKPSMNLPFLKNRPQNLPKCWKNTLLSILVVTLLSFLIFFETWASIVEIWSRSNTYTHGYIIIPISIWLVWSKRHRYKNQCPSPNKFPWLIIISSGFLWLTANLINVLVIQQYAVVGMLIGSIWVILGTRITLQMIFPLAFLFLMVPVGESLIPSLMEYTATFTVAMLRFTGLSVFREGMHFSLTSGNWSVVEACSGINYLIASITLGLVFAYITYSSFWKRALFFFFSILIPIIANGFRAYMIVMIGHLSGMKLAVGVDHILYGAVFFGLVILAMFYIGSFWKDSETESAENFISKDTATPANQKHQLTVILSAIGIMFLIWPLTSTFLTKQQIESSHLINDFTTLKQLNWQPVIDPGWSWTPTFKGVTAEAMHYFKKNHHIVGLYQANFGEESQGGSELVNSEHILIKPKDPKWRINSTGYSELKYHDEVLNVDKSILRSSYKDILVQRWYLIGQNHTANPYQAKWFQLIKRLTGNSSPELQIILVTQATLPQYKDAEVILNNFGENWLSSSF